MGRDPPPPFTMISAAMPHFLVEILDNKSEIGEANRAEFQVSEIVREPGFSASPSHQERGKGRPEQTWLLGSTPGNSVEAALLLERVGSTRLSGHAAQCAACPTSVGLIGPA
ncbi:hypothetical protein U1Q18_009584 [Sarracenia purpurea var. burkii]